MGFGGPLRQDPRCLNSTMGSMNKIFLEHKLTTKVAVRNWRT